MVNDPQSFTEQDILRFRSFRPILIGSAPTVRDPRLLIESDGKTSIYYAPFEYLNPQAKIVLVGITPGPTQMQNANAAARHALLEGADDLAAMKAAKDTAAFSGEPMRSNLIRQLNDWGFDKWLGVDDSSAFFDAARNMIQTTSLIRYPTFVDGKDYRGAPDMTRHPLLRKHLTEYFVAEVARLPDAVFIGLGPTMQKTLDALVQQGVLDGDRVIGGMLHPSPNCTYRINYLVGNRAEAVPHATNPVPYDRGRNNFRLNYLAS